VTRLFVLARHGESTLNVERVVSGGPGRDVPLTDKGRDEARLLGRQLRNCDVRRLRRHALRPDARDRRAGARRSGMPFAWNRSSTTSPWAISKAPRHCEDAAVVPRRSRGRILALTAHVEVEHRCPGTTPGILRAASSPSVVFVGGMRMSKTARSGSCLRTRASSSVPSPA
jgi:Histidine phosphatase superfamily (branch 1)